MFRIILFMISIVVAENNFFDCNDKNPKTGQFYLHEGHPCCRSGDTSLICYNLDKILDKKEAESIEKISQLYSNKVLYTDDVEVCNMDTKTKWTVHGIKPKRETLMNGGQHWESTIYYTVALESNSIECEIECSLKNDFICPHLLNQAQFDSIKLVESIKSKKRSDNRKKDLEKKNERAKVELEKEKQRIESKKSVARTYLAAQNWPQNIKEAVENKQVILGMTKEQVKLSWGDPNDVNRTISKNYEREQWVYGRKYLYFINGILDTIQD